MDIDVSKKMCMPSFGMDDKTDDPEVKKECVSLSVPSNDKLIVCAPRRSELEYLDGPPSKPSWARPAPLAQSPILPQSNVKATETGAKPKKVVESLWGRPEREQRKAPPGPVTITDYSFTSSSEKSISSSASIICSDWSSDTSDIDDSSTRSADDSSEYYYYSSEYLQHEEDEYEYDPESSYDDYSDTDVPISPEAGKWYPEYDLGTLGKGNFGEVYLSYSKANKMYFAVKCSQESRPETVKCLTREAAILKTLNSPYVIEYLGEYRVPKAIKSSKGVIRTKPMVIELYLQYMKRGNLADFIHTQRKKKRKIRESVIRSYTKQILRGISYIHSKNIIHCDIKGSNILLGKTHLKLSDFGASKYVRTTSSTNRAPVSRAGTRAWMAPEVSTRTEQGFPSDVWSLGCTMVQMITGKPPVAKELGTFLDLLAADSEGSQPPIVPKKFNRLSTECIDFLGKCFLRDTKARWTCEQLLRHPFLTSTR